MVRRITVPAELDPITRDATPGGVDADGARIGAALADLYRTGLHPALSLCLRQGGEILIDRAIGYASGAGPHDPPGTPRIPATPDTPFCIFSASKAVTALLIHHLDDQGVLHIDDRVSEYLPEFAAHGKGDTTIRHILTHRAGIPSLGPPHNDVENLLHWDRVVRLLCEARPTTRPGRKLAYHAITGGFILGEIVRRTTGRDIRALLHDTVLAPLGFEGMNYGWPAHRLPEVAVNAHTGPTVPWPLSRIVERALSVPWAEAVRISNDPRYLTGVVPAGNIVATAREVSRFYELLLNEGELDGVRVFDRRTIRRAINESSYLEIDLTLLLPVRHGLGLMLGADHISPFGPRAPRAFGHLGFIQIITWADPDRQLAGALLSSGKPWLGRDLTRLWALLRTINDTCARRAR